ncbi:hypothetical protein, partial [Neisseria dentiae]|uniref:hypothetical protein n=1 Tax=Neisseria dentiae TaxID=194197 RepID=UPI0035A06A80
MQAYAKLRKKHPPPPCAVAPACPPPYNGGCFQPTESLMRRILLLALAATALQVSAAPRHDKDT